MLKTIALLTLPAAMSFGQTKAPTLLKPTPAYGAASIHFLENQQGQWELSGRGFAARFLPTGFSIAMGDSPGQAITFVGASKTVSIEALDPLAGKVNKFLGNDPTLWQRNLTAYARLRYQNLYPGIDLVFYGLDGKLEYDFAVAPGADPSQIRLKIDGRQPVEISHNGDLKVDSIVHRPMLYQNSASGKTVIPGKFAARGPRVAGFDIEAYDKSRELIIDPALTLLYSTYLGGRNTDQATAIKVDSSGNSYILGLSTSVDYPVSGNALQPQIKRVHGQNMVLSKIGPNGTLLYSTYVGGTGTDYPSGLAIDAQGGAYFTGTTGSIDFPVTAGAFQTALQPGIAAHFVGKVSPDGSVLEYSSYFAIAVRNSGYVFNKTSLVLDSTGRVYISGTAEPGLPVAGSTYLPSIPTRIFPTSNCAYAPFIAIFDVSKTGANSLIAVSYVGSTNPNVCARGTEYALVLDQSNNPWITGTTPDFNMPVTANALQSSVQGQTLISDSSVPFITQLSSDLKTLKYSSFWVGTVAFTGFSNAPASAGTSLALDSSGNILLMGSLTTNDTRFPTTPGVIQPAYIAGSAETQGFLTKFSPDGTRVIWSTYLNRPFHNSLNGDATQGDLAIDAQGNAWIGAATYQSITTTADAYQTSLPTLDGSTLNGYIRQISSDGTQLLYSSYFGGQNTAVNTVNTVISSIALDRQQNLHMTGFTASPTFPLSATPFQPLYGNGGSNPGTVDSFFTILAQNPVITSLGPTTVGTGGDTSVTITGTGFSANSGCSLVNGGSTFAAAAVVVAADGSSIQCTFSLTGATPGAYDVSLTAPGKAPITQQAAVTVQSGGQPAVFANVVGRSRIRTGVPSTYYINIGNNGSTDAYYVQWAITLSPNLTFNFPNGPLQVSQPGTNASLNRNSYVAADGTTVIPFLSFHIPAGSSLSIPIQITSPVDQAFTVSAGVQATWYDSFSTAVADFAAVSAHPPTAPATCATNPAKPYLLDCLAHEIYKISFEAATFQIQGNGVSGPATPVPSTIAQFIPNAILALAGQLPVPAASTDAAHHGTALGTARQARGNSSDQTPHDMTMENNAPNNVIFTLIGAAGWLYDATVFLAAKPTGCTVKTALENCTACLGGEQNCVYTVLWVESNCIPFAIVKAEFCNPPQPGLSPQPTPVQHCLPLKGLPGCGGSGGSLDPNYKTGPAGSGTQQYITGAAPSSYSVGFENVATATLPAAQVVITDQLDTTHFDLTTLQLQSIVIGSSVITLPANTGNYTTTIAVNSTLEIRVQGSLNPDTGILKYTFTSIDPTTGLPPTDPTVGFLPPDTDGIKGQGAVTFSIKPKPGLATGTTISNTATIVFDANAPINTPTWTNTLDVDKPVSRVAALPTQVSNTSFLVSWSGTDVGSGIGSYRIYVSDNGAPFTIWDNGVATTSDTYTGQGGHSYAFYSIATDGAGNVENPKNSAEATTTIAGARANPTTTTAASASITYSASSQPVTLSATVTSSSGTVNAGTVTFALLNTSVTANVVNGAASTTFTVPGGTTAGNWPIQASYSGAAGTFAASSDNSKQLSIGKATAAITWPNPAAILFGTALGVTQLNATANTAGIFTYTPALGTVLPVGNNQTLSASFTPSDANDYNPATATAAITVNASSAPSSPANILITKTLRRDPNTNEVVVTLQVSNTGGTAAANVQLTIAKIGTTVTSTTLPQSVGAINPGTTATIVIRFPAAIGTSGSAAALSLGGSYSGGSFNSASRITLP